MIYRLTDENIKESGRKDLEEQLEFKPDVLALRLGGKNCEIPYEVIDKQEIFTQKDTGFIDSISIYLKQSECKGEIPPEGQGWEKAGRGRIFIILAGYQGMEQISSELQKRLKKQTPVEIKTLLRTRRETQRMMSLIKWAVIIGVALIYGFFRFMLRKFL